MAAELDVNGNRNNIKFSMSTAVEVRDHLNAFEEFSAGLEPHNAERLAKNGKLKEVIIHDGGRKYFLSFKEDSVERFLSLVLILQRRPLI